MKRQLKQWLAFVLMATLIINMVGVCLAESGTVSGFGEQTSVAESGMLTIPKTPEQAREMLGAMLGMSAEELDQAAFPAQLYNNQLSEQQWLDTLNEVYQLVLMHQEQADGYSQREAKNVLILGNVAQLSSMHAEHITLYESKDMTLSLVHADALGIYGGEKASLRGVKTNRIYLKNVSDGYQLSIDKDSEIGEIIIDQAGDMTIEGSGHIGAVRIVGSMGEMQMRAGSHMVNESKQAFSYHTPDGEILTLKPGNTAITELSDFGVTYVADGVVIDTRRTQADANVDLSGLAPQKEGHVFTAWYMDEAFTQCVNEFTTVEGEMTLYARFVPENEALSVCFETFGGTPVASQFFAPGETLMSKQILSLLTYRDDAAFGGWCNDEACTEGFGFSDPITESMTLYAYFITEADQTEEPVAKVDQIPQLEWQDEVRLVVDSPMTAEQVSAALTVDMVAGNNEVVLSIRETEDGFAVYGQYYEKNGLYGFEPGASFSLILPEWIHFADFDTNVDTLTINIYRPESEKLAFRQDIPYVLWDEVLSYESVSVLEEEAVLDGDETEGVPCEPGTLLMKEDHGLQVGDIVVLYDGEIGRDEQSIVDYQEGSFNNYVLFAKISDIRQTNAGIELKFQYADPVEYIEEIDVYFTEDVDVEADLTQGELELISEEIAQQVMHNSELKAQMLIAVITAPETRKIIAEQCEKDNYSLAQITSNIKNITPTVKLSVKGSGVTATVGVYATVSIYEDGKHVMDLKPALTITETVNVAKNVKGGFLYIDASVTITTATTISLTVSVGTGNGGVFAKATKALNQLASMSSVTDSVELDENITALMSTMKNVLAANGAYVDIFNVRLLTLRFSFYGIITLGIDVDFVGQLCAIATFGIDIQIGYECRTGINFSFLKFKGDGYFQKLSSSFGASVYLIGKLGIRAGIRLTLSISLCSVATAEISGAVYFFSEWIGLYFLSGSTQLGGIKNEVGIDAEVKITLKVNVWVVIKRINKSKSWTIWSGRWPLASIGASSTIVYMNAAKMDKTWNDSVKNADRDNAFGFSTVATKNGEIMTGKLTEGSFPWNKSLPANRKMTLSIESLKVNGKTVSAEDAQWGVLSVGNAAAGKNPGMVYCDKAVAEKYKITSIEAVVAVTYENTSKSAVVKNKYRSLL